RAIERGSRTTSGLPGAKYWINTASYKITASIDPVNKRLDGRTDITYKNNSPDALNTLELDLTLNIYRPDAVRNEEMEVTGGVELKRASMQHEVHGTRLVLHPAAPVQPGQTANITIEYGFKIPHVGAGARMGWSKDNLIFMAYWYPQMAVYDDVV